MAELTLHIANKNYSSWSFRPWIAMTVKDIAFREVLTPFEDGAGNPKFRAFSPTGKVPALVHGSLTVWESLAILEYLADLFPEKGLWPADRAARAVARAISAEMASGFSALRSACPMNMRRERRAIAVDARVRGDVQRIEALWTSALAASGGPFLFGDFTAADAMYAPVVNRFDVYDLTRNDGVIGYMERIKALPAWRAWEAAGRAEPWIVPEDEA